MYNMGIIPPSLSVTSGIVTLIESLVMRIAGAAIYREP